MANAEQLLNKAQYAFSSVHYGESRENRRNAARARSLCKKIIRKFPTSTEAATARGILRRLGDEAYASTINVQHRHSSEHMPMQTTTQHLAEPGRDAQLDWRGLLSLIFKAPKSGLAAVGFVAFVLFAILGPFLFLPLVVLLIFFGPLKQSLQPGQAQKVNETIAKINAYVDAKRS